MSALHHLLSHLQLLSQQPERPAVLLNDAELRVVLTRLEQMPGEIIRTVVECLKEEHTTLKGLKYVGPNLRAQVTSVLHNDLPIDLACRVDQDFESIIGMPFLNYVRKVRLIASIEFHANLHHKYSNLLSLLSSLKNAETIYIALPRPQGTTIEQVLGVTADLPCTKKLFFDQGCYIDTDYMDTSKGTIYAHLRSFRAFPMLQSLELGAITHEMYEEIRSWLTRPLLPPFAPSGTLYGLTRLNLRLPGQSIKQAWDVIVTQSGTLEKLAINRYFCNVPVDENLDLGPEVIFPFLRVFSYLGGTDIGYRNTPAVFRAMVLPSVQILGCGDLLAYGHPTDCTVLARKWQQSSPKLKLITFHGLYNNRKQEVVLSDSEKGNLNTFMHVLGSQVSRIAPLRDANYERFFDEHMSFNGKAEPVM